MESVSLTDINGEILSLKKSNFSIGFYPAQNEQQPINHHSHRASFLSRICNGIGHEIANSLSDVEYNQVTIVDHK